MNLEIPENYRNTLRVGTCSWKYDTWKGLVYEVDALYHADDYLVDYSRSLSSVEVDQWFWSLFPGETKMPDPRTVTTYAASVPADFCFTVKAPNSITLTHFYAKQPVRHRPYANRPNEHFLSVSLVERFLESLMPLHSRLGPIMFQFEFLNTRKMSTREAFFDRLDAFLSELPSGFRYAVETRNPNYLCQAFFDVLREHSACVVLLDGYHMPFPGKVVREHDTRTADFVVLRLHGPDRAGMERMTKKDWSRVAAPRDRGIEDAVEIVRRNADENVMTYVNVNNHYEGCAPLTIERFLDALRQEG